MICLLDNTVLSNFAAVKAPELVRAALGALAATVSEAFAEHERGVHLGRVPICDWSWLPVLQIDANDLAIYQRLRSVLNAGEAACLAIAVSRAYRVFTDDRDARRVAGQMQVPVSGTLGILAVLVRKEQLPVGEANTLLLQMIAAGYRAPITDLRDILAS